MFYKRNFLLLKDVIVVFRSDIKHRFRAYIMIANLSEHNILRISLVNSVVYHITTVFTNNIKNMALICYSVL